VQPPGARLELKLPVLDIERAGTRGLELVSSADALIAFPTILSAGCGISLARSGKSRGTYGRACAW
jgi:hypothetical protein